MMFIKKEDGMKMYDFNGRFSQEYKNNCENCGKQIKLSTQEDKCPEYYTTVYVKCSCGSSVKFTLPVN